MLVLAKASFDYLHPLWFLLARQVTGCTLLFMIGFAQKRSLDAMLPRTNKIWALLAVIIPIIFFALSLPLTNTLLLCIINNDITIIGRWYYRLLGQCSVFQFRIGCIISITSRCISTIGTFICYNNVDLSQI
jgi:hypothetical protein